MAQLLQELGLADSVHRQSEFLGGDLNLLNGDRETSGADVAEVDDGVGSFSDFTVFGAVSIVCLFVSFGGVFFGIPPCFSGSVLYGGRTVPLEYFIRVSSFMSSASCSPWGASSSSTYAALMAAAVSSE